ncbi:MAG: translation initiation factor 2 [Oscillospiraceae bacterium]|nr:translation initiation factor 2 [Oscillospiraceae bacterium]
MMVKGTSRRVIVVDSPDPKLFEQAIFIVKNDAFSQEGVTSQQILGEACRIARGCAPAAMERPPLWRRVPWWGWAAIGAAAAAGAALLLLL